MGRLLTAAVRAIKTRAVSYRSINIKLELKRTRG